MTHTASLLYYCYFDGSLHMLLNKLSSWMWNQTPWRHWTSANQVHSKQELYKPIKIHLSNNFATLTHSRQGIEAFKGNELKYVPKVIYLTCTYNTIVLEYETTNYQWNQVDRAQWVFLLILNESPRIKCRSLLCQKHLKRNRCTYYGKVEKSRRVGYKMH